MRVFEGGAHDNAQSRKLWDCNGAIPSTYPKAMREIDTVPIREERALAAACHLCRIPFPYLAPIGFFLLKRSTSRFVALHAAQAFFEALVLNVVLFVALGVSLMFTLAKVLEAIETRGQSLTWDDLWLALLKAAATWIILGLVSTFYAIRSVIQALQAYRGEWKGSMIAGRMARRVVGTPPLPTPNRAGDKV